MNSAPIPSLHHCAASSGAGSSRVVQWNELIVSPIGARSVTLERRERILDAPSLDRRTVRLVRSGRLDQAWSNWCATRTVAELGVQPSDLLSLIRASFNVEEYSASMPFVLLRLVRAENGSVPAVEFNEILRLAAIHNDAASIEQLLTLMPELEVFASDLTANILLPQFLPLGDASGALLMLNRLVALGLLGARSHRTHAKSPDLLRVFKHLLNAFAELGHWRAAVHVFEEIERVGFDLDAECFSGLMTVFSKTGDVRGGLDTYRDMIDAGVHPTPEVLMALVRVFADCPSHSERVSAVNLIPNLAARHNVELDGDIYAELLRICRLDGDYDRVLALHERMHEQQVASTPQVLAELLAAVSELRPLEDAEAYRAELEQLPEFWTLSQVQTRVPAMIANLRADRLQEALDAIIPFAEQRAAFSSPSTGRKPRTVNPDVLREAMSVILTHDESLPTPQDKIDALSELIGRVLPRRVPVHVASGAMTAGILGNSLLNAVSTHSLLHSPLHDPKAYARASPRDLEATADLSDDERLAVLQERQAERDTLVTDALSLFCDKAYTPERPELYSPLMLFGLPDTVISTYKRMVSREVLPQQQHFQRLICAHAALDSVEDAEEAARRASALNIKLEGLVFNSLICMHARTGNPDGVLRWLEAMELQHRAKPRDFLFRGVAELDLRAAMVAYFGQERTAQVADSFAEREFQITPDAFRWLVQSCPDAAKTSEAHLATLLTRVRGPSRRTLSNMERAEARKSKGRTVKEWKAAVAKGVQLQEDKGKGKDKQKKKSS